MLLSGPSTKHIQYFGRLSSACPPHNVTEHRAEVTLSSLIIQPQRFAKTGGDAQPGLATVLGPPRLDLMESKAKLDHEPYQWSIQIAST